VGESVDCVVDAVPSCSWFSDARLFLPLEMSCERDGISFETPLPVKENIDEGSDDNAAMPPNPNAANSCGRRGLDFLRFICRRFWNHIYNTLKSLPSKNI